MPDWVIVVVGLAIVGGLIYASRQWGGSAAKEQMRKNVIQAARTRKAIDDEVQKLTPDELADHLRGGM
jgi:hypothetical protein